MRRQEKTLGRVLACMILCMSWVFFLTTRAEAASIHYIPLATYRAGRVNITASAKDGSNVTKTVSLIVTPKRMEKPYASNYYKKKLYVSWQTQSGVSGYQIQYSKKKNFSKSATKTKKMSASSYSGRYFSVKKGKYYVRTRSYLKIGKEYYYGDWSKVRTIKVKH